MCSLRANSVVVFCYNIYYDMLWVFCVGIARLRLRVAVSSCARMALFQRSKSRSRASSTTMARSTKRGFTSTRGAWACNSGIGSGFCRPNSAGCCNKDDNVSPTLVSSKYPNTITVALLSWSQRHGFHALKQSETSTKSASSPSYIMMIEDLLSSCNSLSAIPQ